MAKTKAKRLLSLLLSLAMVTSMIVTPVCAADDDDSTSSGTTASETDGESSTSEESITVAATQAEVASIGGTTYSTLAEAVSAATSGQTVTVTGTVSESSTVITVENKSITIELNGQSVSVSYIIASTGATVTIQDSTAKVSFSEDGKYTVTYEGGSLATSNNNGVSATNGGKVVLASGKVSGTYGLRAWGDTTGATSVASTAEVTGGYIYAQECAVTAQGNGAVANISGGVMETADNAVVAGNGTHNSTTNNAGTKITISGGTLIGHIQTSGYLACGIYHPQDGELTITGGTIYVDGGCGILMRGGTLTIEGGIYINTNTSSDRWSTTTAVLALRPPSPAATLTTAVPERCSISWLTPR